MTHLRTGGTGAVVGLVVALAVGLAVGLAVAACGVEETSWDTTPDPAIRAAVAKAASAYGEEVLVALPALVPTRAFDTPGRTLDPAVQATDEWWLVLGRDGRPARMAAFTARPGQEPQLAGTDWADPGAIAAAASAAGRDARVVSAWGHIAVLGEREGQGIVAVPLGPNGAEGARPIAVYSDELRGMSRGGGLGMDPGTFVAIGALAAVVVAIPVVVVARGARRARRP